MNPPSGAAYRGRFAPSPTGALHFGSLVAAVASYLAARARNGKWLVRIEDLDPMRVVEGPSARILRTLERFGLEWDEEVVYQSRRFDVYRAAFESLRSEGLVFPCSCSRKEVVDSSTSLFDGERRYPGTCRSGPSIDRASYAWRVRVNDKPIRFEDRVQGAQQVRLESTSGDFVVRRADGVFAYQLAVVADDADQGVTDVVRGADLLRSTCRQICLQKLLGFPKPTYAHVPIVKDEGGEKLSKQTLAKALDLCSAGAAIWDALDFLGQSPGEKTREAKPQELLRWAATRWDEERIPRVSF